MGRRRFAITASDRYFHVFKAFVDAGWEPVKLFSAPINSHMASNKMVIDLAHQLKLPIQLSRMNDKDMADLKELDCELLVLASYQWRIGDWQKYLSRAINFHPAPLPGYRGAYPLVQGILDRCESWAVTCHRVSAEFDSGDILTERRFTMDPYERHESLDLKTQIELRQLAAYVANNLDSLWDNARPQGPGNYISQWTDDDRAIDFTSSVEQIALQLRAFGNFECIATLEGTRFHVRRAACWRSSHNYAPGVLAIVNGTEYVVTCRDGFVALLEWSFVPPGFLTSGPVR